MSKVSLALLCVKVYLSHLIEKDENALKLKFTYSVFRVLQLPVFLSSFGVGWKATKSRQISSTVPVSQ